MWWKGDRVLKRGEGPQNPPCIRGPRSWLALSAESSEVPTFLAVLHLLGVTSHGVVWMPGSSLWMQRGQSEI